MSGATARRRRGRSSSAASLLAPLLPGLVQHWKARLQGRRGPSPLQPYRELRRLWGKSAVDRRGHERRLPARAGGRRPRASRAAVLLVPVAARGARAAASATTCSCSPGCSRSRASRVAAASWDVANGFSLMGASRDLTLVGLRRGDARALARRRRRSSPGRPTSRRWSPARPARGVWSSPALALGARRVRARRRRRDRTAAGRQPRHAPRADDDPRGAAARVRAAATSPTCSGPRPRGTGSCSCSPRRSSCPTPQSVWWQLAVLPVVLVVLCAALALTETLVAKMRILLVPRLLAVGAVVALLGIAAWLVELDVSGALALGARRARARRRRRAAALARRRRS